MRKRILTTLALAALSTGAMAQYNSRVQLQLGNFVHIGNTGNETPATHINNVGASLQHGVYKNLAIKINYQRWTSLIDQVLNSAHASPSTMDFAVYYKGTNNPVYRGNYNFADIAAVYSKPVGKHHEFFGSIAPSVAWGNIGIGYQNDFHAETVFVGEYEWEPIEPMRRRSVEIGAVAEAGYSYRLGRINTGLSAAYRYYGNDFMTANLQLNIGYNFNSFK